MALLIRRTLVLVQVLDLSQPTILWTTAETLLSKTRERLDYAIRQTSKHDPAFQQKMLQMAWDRLGGRERPVSKKLTVLLASLFTVV